MTTIHVELFDAATGAAIGVSDVPAEQLPESFEASTTLHLGDADWHVTRAEPMTRAEYVRTGRLAITMHRIEHLDPKTILYSLPTIENALPPARDGAIEGAAAMVEDDWRQLELVAAAFDDVIADELAAVRAIHETQRKGVGFTSLHVRARLPQPLAGVALTVEAVRTALDPQPPRSLAVGGALVLGGFAFPRGNGFVYGRELDGLVVELGATTEDAAVSLTTLARTHGLRLVDWCAGASL